MMVGQMGNAIQPLEALKCNIIHITRKKNPLTQTYYLKGMALEEVDIEHNYIIGIQHYQWPVMAQPEPGI